MEASNMEKFYKRTEAADGGVGTRYETKMTAFVWLRLYNRYQDFFLANNIKDGDKFDDLVFNFCAEDGVWNTWFVQLKHKAAIQNSNKKISLSSLRSKNKNQDFYLPLYFKSFLNVKQKFNNPNHHIFGKDFAHTKFLIFTNALLDNAMRMQPRDMINDMLLSTCTSSEYNFHFNSALDGNVFSTTEGSQVNEFTEKLLMCTGQASEDLMDEINIIEISKCCKLEHTDAQFVLSQLYQFLEKWYSQHYFLTKDHLRQVLSKAQLQTKSNRADDLEVEFTQGFFRNFVALKSHPIIAVLNKESTSLCKAALKQALHNHNVTNLTVTQVDENRMSLETEWTSTEGKFLIVDCSVPLGNVDLTSLALFFSRLSQVGPKNYVVLIIGQDDERLKVFRSNCKAQRVTFNCSLKDISSVNKEFVLDADISFQGYDVKLCGLAQGTVLDDVFNSSMLTQLFEGKKVEVGVKPVEHIDYYVNRLLLRKPYINKNIFETKKKIGTLAVSGVSYETLLSTVKLQPGEEIHMSSTISSWASLVPPGKAIRLVLLDGDDIPCQLEAIRNVVGGVHWLKMEKKSWVWACSLGEDVRTVEPFVNNRPEVVSTENIMEISKGEKTVVVVAEPGMGKTTLLRHMAAQTKNLCPGLWVIFLALNDYTPWFSRTGWRGDDEASVKDLLKDAAGISSETSKFDARLFELCYTHTGNMVVIMDGFDEISPYYSEPVCLMLDLLRRSKVSRVWVTTRPVQRNMLMSRLGVFPYTIKPFETKDQQLFFRKFWQAKYPKMIPSALDCFIDKLLLLVRNSFNDEASQFTGIPLQTKMLSEAFDDKMELYSRYGVLALPEKINILELFDTFVQAKFQILTDEKSKTVATNALVRSEAEQLNELRRSELMRMALVALLQPDDRHKVNPPIADSEMARLRDNMMKGRDKIGIVDHFENDMPHFVHRTFAEYFAAMFLVQNMEANRSFLMSDIFWSESLALVRHMFDRMLCRGLTLHNSILDGTGVISLSDLSESQLHEFDEGGRSPLHLAAASGIHTDLVKQLVEVDAGGSDVRCADRILHWTPLDYAVSSKSLVNIGLIMEVMHQSEIRPVFEKLKHTSPLELIRLSIKKDFLTLFIALMDRGLREDIGPTVLYTLPWLADDNEQQASNQTLLHVAASQGALKILNFLLEDEGANSLAKFMDSQDDSLKTCLHYAVISEHTEIVELLLKKGVKIDLEDAMCKSPIQYAFESKNKTLFGLFLKPLRRLRPVNWLKMLKVAMPMFLTASDEISLKMLENMIVHFPEVTYEPTTTGYPPLVYAAMKGNLEAVKLLLRSGVHVNEANPAGYTALHMAARYDSNIVQELLRQPGIDLECRTGTGETPLHISVREGCAPTFDLLLSAGAQVSTKNNSNHTIFHAVCENPNGYIFNSLVPLLEKVDVTAMNTKGMKASELLANQADPEAARILNYLEEKTKGGPAKFVPDTSQPTTKTKTKKKKVVNNSNVKAAANKNINNENPGTTPKKKKQKGQSKPADNSSVQKPQGTKSAVSTESVVGKSKKEGIINQPNVAPSAKPADLAGSQCQIVEVSVEQRSHQGQEKKAPDHTAENSDKIKMAGKKNQGKKPKQAENAVAKPAGGMVSADIVHDKEATNVTTKKQEKVVSQKTEVVDKPTKKQKAKQNQNTALQGQQATKKDKGQCQEESGKKADQSCRKKSKGAKEPVVGAPPPAAADASSATENDYNRVEYDLIKF